MNLNQEKIIPQLNNYLILHNIANELSSWKRTFITEAEQMNYSQHEVKFDNVIELSKNYRGNIEITFKEIQNDVITHFGYRSPLYFKIIGWTLGFLTFSFYLSQLILRSLGVFLFILTGSAILIFLLVFVFIIAKFDFKRKILLVDQRDELMAIAHKTQITQIPKIAPETNAPHHKPLPPTFKQILMLQNISNLPDWSNRFLDLLKENGYFIKQEDLFTSIQVIKNKRPFIIGFKIELTTLLLFVGFHRHLYYFLFHFGTIASLVVFSILDRIYDLHYYLFLYAALITISLYIGFFIYHNIFLEQYDSKREMAAPKYIDELMQLASKASNPAENKANY